MSQGQLLFTIDPKPLQAKLEQAQADLATAQADLKQAQATLQRKEKAYASRAVSEVEVIQAQADKAKAEASIKAAQAALGDRPHQPELHQPSTPPPRAWFRAPW